MPNPQTLPSLALKNANITAVLGRTASLQDLSTGERNRLRRDVYLTAQSIGKLLKSKVEIEPADRAVLSDLGNQLTALTNFIPAWVKVAVALALGLGTMIGWKRIVVTIGEKIGRSRLTYAQGASAEVIAMTEIAMADLVGLPVSTTHILASGIAGTMFANHSGLQKETLRNILLAWVLTLPACVILGSVLFSGCLFVALRLF
jgi:PiT family inorganic phosphate transporter